MFRRIACTTRTLGQVRYDTSEAADCGDCHEAHQRDVVRLEADWLATLFDRPPQTTIVVRKWVLWAMFTFYYDPLERIATRLWRTGLYDLDLS